MWYKLPLEEVLARCGTSGTKGLTPESASKRLVSFGKNVLPSGKKRTWVYFLLQQFKSPLVYILLIGALLTVYLHEWVDMSIILLAVTVNVIVGFWQEFKSNNVLEKLKEVVHNKAFVIRDGNLKEVDTECVVPGDIIILKPGNNIPADARVIVSERLEVKESVMTGESAPVGKKVGTISADVAIGDRFNMVHMGTTVVRGSGKAIVVATGAKTELGKIALLTQKAEDELTPLQLRMAALGRLITIFVAIAAVFIFVIGILENHTLQEMFTTAIAVAVAAIPEGLPASISIVLAVGAQRIYRKKGIVKRLVAAETLGSASVICADKTGTLTEGKMRVEKILTNDAKPRALEIMALANEGLLEKEEGRLIVRGETTDQAKLQAFLDDKGDYHTLIGKLPRTSLLSFDPSRKYLASLHNNSGSGLLFVNGAPEIIFDASKTYAVGQGEEELTEEKRKELVDTYTKLAREGYRMIALADKEIPDKDFATFDLEDEKTRTQHIQELRFVGFAAIRDPIRKEVPESITIAREAGIRTIMLTGDHILTASAIGKELGFSTETDTVIEGAKLRSMSDDDLRKALQTAEIFARVNPEDKLRIVELLQTNGEVVAMTGDGINDAPSLKAADIGIAVESGTDVSKAASDMILLNNSFSTIVEAIRQGRTAFDNIRKVTVFLLSGSWSEIILILAALILRVPLPVTAAMILWTNLVEDTLPNVALSFEPGEEDIMRRKPVAKKAKILDTESKVIIFVIGILNDIFLLSIFLYLYFQTELSLPHVQTIVFAGLGLNTFFYIYSIKSLRKPIYSYNIFSNKALIGATIIGVGIMLMAIYVPLFNALLQTVPLPASNWLIIFAIGIVNIISIEIAKWIFFHREGGHLLPQKHHQPISP